MPNSTGSRSLLVRFCVLAALIVAFSSWLGHHTGVSTKTLTWINGIFALGGSIAALAGDAVKVRFMQGVNGVVRPVLQRVLATPVLVVSALIVILLASFTSSVTVIAPAAKGATVTLAFADGEEMEHEIENSKPIRFFCFTTPMGRMATLRMDGYLDKTFLVQPVRGEVIDVSRDLSRAPTVLFRVPFDMTEGKGFVTIKHNGKALPVIETEGNAVLVGPLTSVDYRLAAIWRMQITAENPDLNRARAHAIIGWLNPHHESKLRPQPGDTLRVEYRTAPNGAVLADAEHVVDRSELQDVALRHVDSGG